jgi:ketosteroid isomerase-like protein
LVLSLVCLPGAPLAAADLTPDEQAVWQLEEQYWVYVAKSDIEGYRTLWDERFVGWPSFSPSPVGKDDIGSWIRPLHADPEQKFRYTLEQMAVRSFGEIVVAHYLVKEEWVSVKTGQISRSESSRITHTWKKRGDGWVIITGMSSRVQ